MKCPHCHREITLDNSLRALRYMVGKGWLFPMTIPEDKWKKDDELVEWMSKGWIKMDPKLGFHITEAGIRAITR